MVEACPRGTHEGCRICVEPLAKDGVFRRRRHGEIIDHEAHLLGEAALHHGVAIIKAEAARLACQRGDFHMVGNQGLHLAGAGRASGLAGIEARKTLDLRRADANRFPLIQPRRNQCAHQENRQRGGDEMDQRLADKPAQRGPYARWHAGAA